MHRIITILLCTVFVCASAFAAEATAPRVSLSWEVGGKAFDSATMPLIEGKHTHVLLWSPVPRDRDCRMLTLDTMVFSGKGYVAVTTLGRATKGEESWVCFRSKENRVQYPMDARSGRAEVGDPEGSVLVWKIVP